ncbi:MAG: DUF2726 domain-containing protein [Treponema sp.]|jgi:superfamily I DNA and/or RNA helicase|nr:DUF2726 domain-containing protein [Treponema sp.]
MLKDKIIIVKGEDKTNSISTLNESDGKILITYQDGQTFPYNKKNVQIIYSALTNETALKRFIYLKRIAQIVGLKDTKGENILANRYEKIDFLHEENILSAFLTEKLHKEKKVNPAVIVFPFGFNISQKIAIDNAFKTPLTIIEGPPGTGKTQTILNIIANAVMFDKSVAVVSSNNSATANVQEKLKKYQVDFIAAYLGNSDNKKDFIKSQKELPDMSDWELSVESRKSMNQSLQYQYRAISAMLEKRNELSQIKQELDAIELEYRHFIVYYEYDENLPSYYIKPVVASNSLLKLWFTCDKHIKRNKLSMFLERLFNTLFNGWKHLGVKSRKFYSLEPDMMIAICQKRWYVMRIEELNKNKKRLQSELDLFNFIEKMETYTALSAQLFRSHLFNKYKNRKRKQFELKDLWKNSENFIDEYPVILSTTYSLRSSLSNRVMYDYVIIDEASQVDIATGALALSCARNAVIVGDLKQLPNVVDSDTAQKTDIIFSEFDLPDFYRYKNHSLLLAVSEIFPKAPRTLLREHYRCHPKIIGFCNQKFYNGDLIILTELKSTREPLMVYKTSEGNHARDHVNQRQIDVIKNEIIPQQKLFDGSISIGIVTPYRNQTKALKDAFAGSGIQADTVDKFQGRENDVIILSTVDNKISDFTDNANRLNVAISRAIDQLIVIVNSGDDMQDKNIGDLLRYIEYNNFEIKNSAIYSVFDYLYSGYRDKLKDFLKKQKQDGLIISEFPSENLMYDLILKVLKNEQFVKYDVAVHVPLMMIIRDMKVLNEKEIQYAKNILTHVDFLIFDKIGKTPRLVIEVDGVKFHKEKTRQAERDELKNKILLGYGLPYVRFRTNESNEEKKLIEILEKII